MIGSPYGERYDRDWPELAEIAFLKRYRLRQGATVFDLGANHGVVALMLANVVGPTGRVVALEADTHGANLLRRNAAINQTGHLHGLHAAIAGRHGRLLFGVNGEVDDPRRRWGGHEVQGLTIDDLAKRFGQPEVVFMDVEGYELEALAGAQATLGACPDWFVEVHGGGPLDRYGGSVEEVLAAFPIDRYERFVAEDRLVLDSTGRLHSLTDFRPIEEMDGLSGRFFLIAIGRS